MKKIRTANDLVEFVKSASDGRVVSTIYEQDFKGLHLVEVDSIDKLQNNLFRHSAIATILSDSDAILLCGPYGVGKREFAQSIIGSAPRPVSRDTYLYDYRETRDNAQRYGLLNEKQHAIGMRSVDAAMLAYGLLSRLAGMAVVVCDPALTTGRRKAIMEGLGVMPEKSFSTAIMLVGDHGKMIERNDLEDIYKGRTRSYEDYLKETSISYPRFFEGFRNIVVINETNRSSRNYIKNSNIKEHYFNQYKDSIKYFDYT